MEKPWKVVAAFIGVFIAGAVFGGFFTLRNPARRQLPAQPVVQLPPAEQPKTQVAGPTAGAVAVKQETPRSSPIAPHIMRQFTKTLKLTPEQREKVGFVVGRASEDFQRLRDEDVRRRQDNFADVARVNERMYADISNLLTPEQRVELQTMRQKAEDRMLAEKQKTEERVRAERQKEKERRDAEAAAKMSGAAGDRPAAKTGP